jgi:hypothetical protein
MTGSTRWACFVTCCLGACAICLAEERCKYPKQEGMKRLENEHGDKDGAEHFRSLSGAKPTKDEPTDYTRLLVNQHEKNLLPAEWEEAGIAFSQIRPGKCGRNVLQSSREPEEKEKTTIKYGNRNQRKATVSLITMKEAKVANSSETKKTYPALRSSIYADTEKGAVDFRFKCVLDEKEKRVVYSAWVVTPKEKEKGTVSLKEALFTAHDIDSAVRKYKVNPGGENDWKNLKTGYLAEGENSRTASRSIRWGGDLAEKQIQMELYTMKSERLGKGLVSVYLPAAGK